MALTKGKIIGFNVLMQTASLAAQEAIVDFDPRGQEFNCGFAWVTMSGKGDFANYLKKFRGASKNYGTPGINLWYSRVYNPRGSQSMYKHIQACEAFCDVLREHGISCHVESRLD